jgi:hypothetical protein
VLLYFYILLLTSDKNTIKKNNNNAVTRLLNRGTKINGNMLIPFASEFVSNANLNNLRIVNKKNENIKVIDNLRKKVFIILKN